MSRNEHGFTLLEIVIALAIASLACVALMQAVSGGLRATSVSGHYQEALSRAHSHLEQLGTNLQTGEQSGAEGEGFKWHVAVQPIAVALGHVSSSEKGGTEVATLFGVTVVVEWDTDGGHQELVLSTRRLGFAATGTR